MVDKEFVSRRERLKENDPEKYEEEMRDWARMKIMALAMFGGRRR